MFTIEFMKIKRVTIKTGHLLRETFSEFFGHNGLQLSAALSCYILFSLTPLLVIIISLCGLFFGEQAVRGEIYDQINGLVGERAASEIQQVLKTVKLSPETSVATTIGMNSFGRNLGFQKGDALLSVNSIDLRPENFKDGLNRFKAQTKAGEKVKVEIMRQDKKGNWKKKTLSGTAEMVERDVYLHIDWTANPTEKQLLVRKAWIKN